MNADDEQDYQGWMKTTVATAGKLRKELDAKAFPDVAKDAATLQDVFKKVEMYWAKTNTADAVKFAQDAQAAAKSLVAAAGSENAEQSAASLKMMMATCAGVWLARAAGLERRCGMRSLGQQMRSPRPA